MRKTITLELRTEDAEPLLREAAERAAKYGAFLDNFTKRTYMVPRSGPIEDAREVWKAKFLKAKRMVEAFGVEYEPTSEGETLTIYIPDKVLKSHLVKIAGVTLRHIDKSEPDFKNPLPCYRGGTHEEACRQAADRVVRRWRAMIEQAKAA